MLRMRKILWIANGIIEKIGMGTDISQGDIGWISSIVENLVQAYEVELIYLFPQTIEKRIISGICNEIKYYAFYQNEKKSWKRSSLVENQIYDVVNTETPDVIQIWGTEFAHSLDAFEAIKRLGMEKQTIVYIQGLVSVYAEQYYAGLPERIIHGVTFRDACRNDNIRQARTKYAKRGRNEVKLISEAKHVLGRTDWDLAHCKKINSNVIYHKCNESMREVFFQEEWNYSKCEKYSIFVTQGNYPIKGFHYLLEAITLVKRRYPEIQVYIAGESILRDEKNRLRESTYGRYIRKMIEKKGLREAIHFLGYLSSVEIMAMYLRANAFVLPSVIENSPNSFAEALVVGTPCVVSYVGGVQSMVENEQSCFFYQHNDSCILAYYIEQIFSMRDEIQILSEQQRMDARVKYDACVNNRVLWKVYEEVCIKGGAE